MTATTTGVDVPDLLEAIVASTRRTLEMRAERESMEALESRARRVPTRPGVFAQMLSRDASVNIIAECKRRSLSRGLLRADYDAVTLAVEYAEAGAAAISVLTEPTFFDGSLDHLAAVRKAVDVPILRKDFIIDRYQVLEARAAGADAVLLIVAALGSQPLRSLLADAASCGIDALVEVHDQEELSRAVDAGATIVGVNNRNLRTLAVDVHLSERIAASLPRGVVAVAESGLQSGRAISRLQQLGFRAFLVGEHLVTSATPGAEVRRLLEEARA